MRDERTPDDQVTVIVLTGGRSSRMGQDKATMRLGERSMLDRVLGAVPTGVPVVIAGPHASARAGAKVVREQRPFGGPASGLAAAVPVVETPFAVVVAVDMPFALPQVLPLVSQLADSDADAMIPVDQAGRRQMLAAAYRTGSLRRALEALEDPYGRPLRDVVEQLSVLEVRGLGDPTLADVDTPDDALSVTAVIAKDDPLA